MAFQFPVDKADFTAANGITYSWDARDDKWRVKAFRFDDGDYLLKPYTIYVGDAPPDKSVAPDGEFQMGELWYSTITLELFAYGDDAWWPTAADFTGDIALINSILQQAEKDIDQNEQDIDDLQAKVEELLVTRARLPATK